MDFLLDKWKKGRVWWKVDQTCHPFFLPLPPSLFFATMCRLQCATGIRNRQGYSRRRGLKFLLWKFDYLLFFVFYFCLNDASLFPGSRTDCGVASRFYQNGTERNSICFLFLVTFSRRPMRFPIQRAHLLLPILPVSFSFFLFFEKRNNQCYSNLGCIFPSSLAGFAHWSVRSLWLQNEAALNALMQEEKMTTLLSIDNASLSLSDYSRTLRYLISSSAHIVPNLRKIEFLS